MIEDKGKRKVALLVVETLFDAFGLWEVSNIVLVIGKTPFELVNLVYKEDGLLETKTVLDITPEIGVKIGLSVANTVLFAGKTLVDLITVTLLIEDIFVDKLDVFSVSKTEFDFVTSFIKDDCTVAVLGKELVEKCLLKSVLLLNKEIAVTPVEMVEVNIVDKVFALRELETSLGIVLVIGLKTVVGNIDLFVGKTLVDRVKLKVLFPIETTFVKKAVAFLEAKTEFEVELLFATDAVVAAFVVVL